MAILPPADVDLFTRSSVALMVYANRKLSAVPGFDSDVAFRASSIEDRLKVRDALYANRGVIEEFVAENPAQLPPDDLALVAAWRQAVTGRFYVLRHLKRYTVLLDEKDPPTAYGVFGITNEIENLLPADPPIMVDAVLLPWRDKITYDGLLHVYNIRFSAGIRRSLNEQYQRIKATTGLVETLNGTVAQSVRRRPKKQGPSVDHLLGTLDRIEHEIVGLKALETPAQRGAFATLSAAVVLARHAIDDQPDLDEVIRAWRQLDRALRRLQTSLDLR